MVADPGTQVRYMRGHDVMQQGICGLFFHQGAESLRRDGFIGLAQGILYFKTQAGLWAGAKLGVFWKHILAEACFHPVKSLGYSCLEIRGKIVCLEFRGNAFVEDVRSRWSRRQVRCGIPWSRGFTCFYMTDNGTYAFGNTQCENTRQDASESAQG